jgi:hypothetical protein
MTQNRSSAVMHQRTEAPDALDDFPTMPWATRAVLEIIKEIEVRYGHDMRPYMTAREPCANRGYMVRPMEEVFGTVHPSDVHDYGSGYPVLDYLFPGPMLPAQWTVMNPPFNMACRFILKSFETPGWVGTAALVRTGFLEGVGRFNKLFSQRAPNIIAQFVERVPMLKGRVDPKGSTASSYCWMIWREGLPERQFRWIPPCRKRLERPGDYPTDNLEPDGAVHEGADLRIL